RSGLARFGRRTSLRAARLTGRRALADHGQVRADGYGLVLLREDLLQRPRYRRRDLGVDLVRRHLEKGFVHFDGVADVLEPSGDRPLGDGLAQGRHGHAVGHELGLLGWLRVDDRSVAPSWPTARP